MTMDVHTRGTRERDIGTGEGIDTRGGGILGGGGLSINSVIAIQRVSREMGDRCQRYVQRIKRHHPSEWGMGVAEGGGGNQNSRVENNFYPE